MSKGFTLWEVLIALSLFSITIILVGNIQIKNLSVIKSTHLQRNAINEIQEAAWCLMNNESFNHANQLPNEKLFMNGKNIELHWQTPVSVWHCQGKSQEKESCLAL